MRQCPIAEAAAADGASFRRRPDLGGVRPNGHPGGNGKAPELLARTAPPKVSPIKSTRQAGSPQPPQPILAQEASPGRRDRLLDELAMVTTADDLAAWAHRVLPTKNTLRTEDAAMVEAAFAAALDRLGAGDHPDNADQRLEVPPSAAADGPPPSIDRRRGDRIRRGGSSVSAEQ